MTKAPMSYISCTDTDVIIQLTHLDSPVHLTNWVWKIANWGSVTDPTILIKSSTGRSFIEHGKSARRYRPGRAMRPPSHMRGVFFRITDARIDGDTLILQRTAERSVKRYPSRNSYRNNPVSRNVQVVSDMLAVDHVPTIQQFRDAITTVNSFKQSMGNSLVLAVRDDGMLSATMEI